MKLPGDDQRHVIAGRTGWGKTHEAMHQLSQRSFDEMPWVVIDLKGNDLVARIPVTGIRSIEEPPPREPGLYAVNAKLEHCENKGRLERFLFECLDQGRVGIVIDEGQLLGQNNRGLRAVLTRGRSQSVPLMFLCQRPVHVDTFVLSESEYLQFFLLQHPDDYERVERYVDRDRLDIASLRELGDKGRFHSYLYDVPGDEIELLGPCPPFQDIYDRILTRLPVYEDTPGPAGLPRHEPRRRV